MVAVGTVIGAKNRVQALRGSESLLNTRGGNGHAVAGLVTSAASTAVASHTLEERSCQIDAASGSAVGFGRAAGIQEKCSVGNESKLLSTDRHNKRQHENGYQNSAEETAAANVNALQFARKLQ